MQNHNHPVHHSSQEQKPTLQYVEPENNKNKKTKNSEPKKRKWWQKLLFLIFVWPLKSILKFIFVTCPKWFVKMLLKSPITLLKLLIGNAIIVGIVIIIVYFFWIVPAQS